MIKAPRQNKCPSLTISRGFYWGALPTFLHSWFRLATETGSNCGTSPLLCASSLTQPCHPGVWLIWHTQYKHVGLDKAHFPGCSFAPRPKAIPWSSLQLASLCLLWMKTTFFLSFLHCHPQCRCSKNIGAVNRWPHRWQQIRKHTERRTQLNSRCRKRTETCHKFHSGLSVLLALALAHKHADLYLA